MANLIHSQTWVPTEMQSSVKYCIVSRNAAVVVTCDLEQVLEQGGEGLRYM